MKTWLMLWVFALSSLTMDARASIYPQCDPEAFKDYAQGSKSTQETLAILSLVTERNFDSFKQSLGGNIALPIDGIPVQFGADWSHFEEKRREVASSYSSIHDVSSSRRFVSYKYSANGTQAYLACVQTQTRAFRGLHLYVEQATEGSFSAVVYWNQAGTSSKVTTLQISRDGSPAKLVTQSFPLLPGGRKSIPVTRNSRTAMRLTVNLPAGEDSDEAKVDADPKIPEPVLNPTYSVTDSQPHTYGFRFGARSSGGKVALIIGTDGCGDYDSSLYGAQVSRTAPTATLVNRNAATGASVCSPFPRGSFTLVENPDWDFSYLLFDGVLDRADNDTTRTVPNPVEIHAYVARFAKLR